MSQLINTNQESKSFYLMSDYTKRHESTCQTWKWID